MRVHVSRKEHHEYKDLQKMDGLILTFDSSGSVVEAGLELGQV